MSNVLDHDTQRQIVALGRLGWSLRRIEQATGHRRETISGYLKAAGIVVPGRGRRATRPAKPAISLPAVSTDFSSASGPDRPPGGVAAPRAKAAIRCEVSTDLLGYAIASKLYPGVLVLYLLLRRDWSALRWTAATGAALGLVSVFDVGWTPIAAFAAHLPRLLSGEAFPGLRVASAIAINESVPGLVFKLGLVGVPGMDFAAAQVVGWLHTVVLVGMTAWLVLRADRRFDPLMWIAILILATLRSPFLPGFGPFPALWLATLVIAAASAAARPRLAAVSAALWLVLAFAFGQSAVSPSVNAVLTFGHTLASLTLVFVVLPRLTETRALSAR